MKKLLVSSALLLAATGCGKEGQSEDNTTPVPGVSGTSCSVSEVDEGALIECEDGTEALVKHGSIGQQGPKGEDGEPGQPGKDGSNGVDGAKGTDGEDGKDGAAIEVKTPMVYEGYYCSRTIVSIDTAYYLVYSGMIKLSSSWYKVSASCSVRVRDGVVQTK